MKAKNTWEKSEHPSGSEFLKRGVCSVRVMPANNPGTQPAPKTRFAMDAFRGGVWHGGRGTHTRKGAKKAGLNWLNSQKNDCGAER